jgi:phosphate starvation-inducible PhoH-like protein
MGKKGRKAKNYGRHRLLSISSDEGDYDNEKDISKPKPSYFEAKTKNQSLFLQALNTQKSQAVVCYGSAGTGKTLLSCQEAVKSLLSNTVNGIIITRPAICADEDLGFLPGEVDDKMRPFVQPVYDCLEKIVSKAYLEIMIKRNQIQIVPLAFMRGRTFESKFIIADEMQNSTVEQMKMILTRIGKNSKLVVIGDPLQTDRKIKCNGLADLINRMKKHTDDIQRIKCIRLETKDIQREDVVREVLNVLYHKAIPPHPKPIDSNHEVHKLKT